MNKCKIVIEKGRKFFVFKSEKGQQLSEREKYIINNNEAPGFLHFSVEQKGAIYKLSYDITGLITLNDYLGAPLTKDIFVKLIQNIFGQLKIVKDMYFKQEALVLDFDKVMVKATTGELLFLYVPIPNFQSGVSLREFLLNIIRKSSFVPHENSNYVQEYIRILNRGINFSIFELEEYISKLANDETAEQQKVQCPFCKTYITHNTYYCPQCGNKVTTSAKECEQNFYNPLGIVKDSHVSPSYPVEEIKVNQQLTPKCEVVSQVMLPSQNSCLVRTRTGEHITINKEYFRIGKGTLDNDYCVSDNSAVSRSHVVLLAKDKQWTIVDLNSTNGTYVDGTRIMPRSEIPLNHGSKISLADEEFLFYLQ